MPILVPEPKVAVALGLVTVANDPELDEVAGRVIPNGPDTDRAVVVGGDKGVALTVTLVADTVGARARRGCLRPDIDDVVDFVAFVDFVAAPDPTRFPGPADIPVPTPDPAPTPAFSTFPPSRFSLPLASRLRPPETGGLMLLLSVPLLVAETLAILLIPVPPIAVPMLLGAAVREIVPGTGNVSFVVDGTWIIETGRCFGVPIPAPLVEVLLLADVPFTPVVGVSFISLAVLVGFRSDRVRSSALGCREGFKDEEEEEDIVTESFLLLGGGDWMVLFKVSVIHSRLKLCPSWPWSAKLLGCKEPSLGVQEICRMAL